MILQFNDIPSPRWASKITRIIVYSTLVLFAIELLKQGHINLQRDFQAELVHVREKFAAEIADCRKSWIFNCSRDTIHPGLSLVCKEWGKCMERDPGDAKLTAEMRGKVIDSFVNALDLRPVAALGFLYGVAMYRC